MLTQDQKTILSAITSEAPDILARQAEIRAMNDAEATALIDSWLSGGLMNWENKLLMYQNDIKTLTNKIATAEAVIESIKKTNSNLTQNMIQPKDDGGA